MDEGKHVRILPGCLFLQFTSNFLIGRQYQYMLLLAANSLDHHHVGTGVMGGSAETL